MADTVEAQQPTGDDQEIMKIEAGAHGDAANEDEEGDIAMGCGAHISVLVLVLASIVGMRVKVPVMSE